MLVPGKILPVEKEDLEKVWGQILSPGVKVDSGIGLRSTLA